MAVERRPVERRVAGCVLQVDGEGVVVGGEEVGYGGCQSCVLASTAVFRLVWCGRYTGVSIRSRHVQEPIAAVLVDGCCEDCCWSGGEVLGAEVGGGL